ncbi:UNVERIFIED_CONTAM: hypothetical protein NCL1_35275 [Trichonephila clavipes]
MCRTPLLNIVQNCPSPITLSANVYKLYPAMAPVYNSTELFELQINSPDINPGLGRTASLQACFQFLYVIEVILVAIITGLVTGI